MIDSTLTPIVLCFLRVSGFVAFLPPFGGRHLPHTVKIGLVVALTLFWIPRAGQQSRPTTTLASRHSTTEDAGTSRRADRAKKTSANGAGARSWVWWSWMTAREVTIGAALGWLLGTILIPIRIAGAYIAQEMGLSIATFTSSTDSSSTNVLATIFESFGIFFLYSMNLHHESLRLFDRLLDYYPLGGSWRLSEESEWVTSVLTSLPERGLVIAAPIAVVMFLVLLVLLFAMKQAPQFNLFTFGMPARLLAGVIALTILFPDILRNIVIHYQRVLHG